MQILFVRDASSMVRQFEVTPRRILISLVMLTLLLMSLNLLATWLIEALGLQSAEVVTAQSLSESQYERKLVEMESQIDELNARLKGLDATKQQIIQDQPIQPQRTPAPVDQPSGAISPSPNTVGNTGGQGGPMLHTLPQASDLSFVTRLDRLELATLDLKSRSQQVGHQLQTLQTFQAASPTGYPLPYAAQVTSLPGFRIDPFTGQSSWHAGTDYAAYTGTPILATGDGYVIRAELDPEFGNVVEISHPGVNVITRYAHADQIHVKLGQRIMRGEAIASVGSTGRSTGPHLHYEIR